MFQLLLLFSVYDALLVCVDCVSERALMLPVPAQHTPINDESCDGIEGSDGVRTQPL
jgi:hypothetical protein